MSAGHEACRALALGECGVGVCGSGRGYSRLLKTGRYDISPLVSTSWKMDKRNRAWPGQITRPCAEQDRMEQCCRALSYAQAGPMPQSPSRSVSLLPLGSGRQPSA
ncbi:hypothetical protein AAFF_G00271250 [Aldrovandia affinis]|uniref:Uncharacterized protein n=1 Tax=Aldrovandia affinis TaxID=143900 RepID=A0AAD7W2D3_9TELE|nr:hypothetical protein AAFF_G00271250 [Aldrovandia affinis]